MEFLKHIIPDDWYLRFFPPEEDTSVGVELYLHIRDGKYIIPFAHGITRSQVVEFLKDINSDTNLGRSDNKSDEEDIELGMSADEQELTQEQKQHLGELFALPVKTISQIIINTFSGAEILFIGGGEITIEHEKDQETGMWQTWFVKTIKQENYRIACINTSKLVRWKK